MRRQLTSDRAELLGLAHTEHWVHGEIVTESVRSERSRVAKALVLEKRLQRYERNGGTEGELIDELHGTHSDKTMLEQGWQIDVIEWLHKDATCNFFLCMLVLDCLCVIVMLQLQMESQASLAKGFEACYTEMVAAGSFIDKCADISPPMRLAKNLERVRIGLAWASTGIIFVFLVENILLILCTGFRFFTVPFYVLDLVAIIMSFATEITFLMAAYTRPAMDPPSPEFEVEDDGDGNQTSQVVTQGVRMAVSGAHSSMAVLILLPVVGRFWRFFRIMHAVYSFNEHEAWFKTLTDLSRATSHKVTLTLGFQPQAILEEPTPEPEISIDEKETGEESAVQSL
mmetsp:Transcript_81382/g.143646  ORF Transcript_81382/g.143646 Transcript_81382/m.143646 type:complete len:342 (-) Transcript_81382:39-1064(-)